MVGVTHIQSKNVRSLLDQLPQYIYAFRDRSQRADDFGLTHDDQISRRLPKIGANNRKEIARGAGLLQRIKMRHAFSDVPRCAVSVLPISACFCVSLAKSRCSWTTMAVLAAKFFTSGSLPLFASS